MTDFKLGDKVVVRPDIASAYPWWTEGKVYTVDAISGVLLVLDDRDNPCRVDFVPERFLPAPAPDADGWLPMPKLKAGDPMPEWLLDERTDFKSETGMTIRHVDCGLWPIFSGKYTHYRPAPKAEIATTPSGKQYRISHGPGGSVTAEVV